MLDSLACVQVCFQCACVSTLLSAVCVPPNLQSAYITAGHRWCIVHPPPHRARLFSISSPVAHSHAALNGAFTAPNIPSYCQPPYAASAPTPLGHSAFISSTCHTLRMTGSTWVSIPACVHVPLAALSAPERSDGTPLPAVSTTTSLSNGIFTARSHFTGNSR